MPVLVGTSGWQYRDWRGVLYPPGLAQRRWLEYYASHYATVENNGAFYRLPSPQTFADWRARTPDDFVMAVKASRYLTHVLRLRDAAGPVGRLLGAAAGLGSRLGPVLLQLPPNFPVDPVALEDCLREFAAFRMPGEPGASGAAAAGCGWRWNSGTSHGGPNRSGSCWRATTPPCAGRTGSAARPARCGARPTGATSACTRALRSRGRATGSPRWAAGCSG